MESPAQKGIPFDPSAIFIFSMEPWGDMWYSKHHYAAWLARTHKVYFVSLPDRWRWKDLFSFGIKVRNTPEGVRVVEYRNNLPLRIIPRWMVRNVGRINALKLRKLMPHGNVLFWCFFPINSVFHPSIRKQGSRYIYHVVDPYQNLPGDTTFARRADLVVTINSYYFDRYSKLNRNCLLVPHGVRPIDREHSPQAVSNIRRERGDYALLATGLGRSVNYSLLKKVATHFSDLTFLVAGDHFPLPPKLFQLRDEFFALPNVEYVGVKHPDDLKDLIKGARLGLLTYDFEETRTVPNVAGRTPLKVLTYLSQMCPVISTNNSYVPQVECRGYYKAEDPDHFVELMEKVLNGTLTVDEKTVNEYLDSVEYEKHIENILRAIGSTARSRNNERIPTRIANGRTKIPGHSPILIVSNEAWDGPRYSKHRYTMALRAMRDVIFIDPAPHWEPTHFFRSRISSRTITKGVVVLSYFNAVPLFGGLLGELNDRIISRRIRSWLKKAGRRDPVLWSFDPSRLITPKLLNAITSVYHCADDHSFRMRGERILAENCDHVFCIARGLMPRFLNLNPSVHYVPHGLGEDDRSLAPPDPAALPAPPGYGLYIGNINDRHDFTLWRKMMAAAPDLKWVIVGPMNVKSREGIDVLEQCPPPNLITLGPIPYEDLRHLIAGAGFGFLYMRPDDPANRFSSQKIVQFLALGKPFFCSWFSDYEDKQHLLYMSDDHSSALHRFQAWRSMDEPPELSLKRIEFTKDLWFERILAQLPFKF